VNKSQTAAYNTILKIFLALPWADRAEVFSAIRSNPVFCTECGYGELDSPNKDCGCNWDIE